MDVVYLFYESAGVRIPFFGYDPEFFRLFIRYGAIWDDERREFFIRVSEDVECCWNFGVPYVQVYENSPDQPPVFGFFKRIWTDDISHNALSNNIVEASRPVFPIIAKPSASLFSFPVPPPPENFSESWRVKLEAALRSRKYSPKTQRAYIYYNRLICRSLRKTPEELTSDDVTQFIADMDKNGQYSASAMNLAVSAIKFFFRNVLKNKDISEQHRPRHDERLPVVLSKEEIIKILSMEKNPKHRLLLMLIYSSGLRVSEVVSLKREHIDLSRKVIYIKLGKGRKDRSTLLSEKAIRFIEEYYNFYDIEKWLFPGQPADHHLSIRSAQNIFEKAVRHAGILKNISIHGLRHTFATHLLENGTDIRYIQTLLGHANLRTTERYTHVARRSVFNIKSPLDSIL
jgi:site-specific recombinase XerD